MVRRFERWKNPHTNLCKFWVPNNTSYKISELKVPYPFEYDLLSKCIDVNFTFKEHPVEAGHMEEGGGYPADADYEDDYVCYPWKSL